MEEISTGTQKNKNIMKEDLKEIFKNVNDWLKFAEAKNAGALTFSSALVFASLKMLNTDNHCYVNIALTVLSVIGASGIILAFISFSPVLNKYYKKKIDGTGEYDNVYFFMDLKDYKDFKNNQDHKALLKLIYKKSGKTYVENALEEDIAIQIITNSQIAFRKYEIFKLILKFYGWGSIIGLIVAGIFFFLIKINII